MGKKLVMIDMLMEKRKCKLYQFPSHTYLFSSRIGLQVQGSKKKDHINNVILSILLRPCNFLFPSFRTECFAYINYQISGFHLIQHFRLFSKQHNNMNLSQLSLKCQTGLERFQSGDSLISSSLIRIQSFFQRDNCNFLIIIFHPIFRMEIYLSYSDKALNYITAVTIVFLISQADSSTSTLSILSCKSVGSIKLVFFSKIFDYHR